MAAEHAINVDLARVYDAAGTKRAYVTTLVWGDEVEVEEIAADHVRIRTVRFDQQADGSIRPRAVSGFIKPPAASGVRPRDVVIPKQDDRVLKVDFVDVQQGDGSVIETPKGRVVLIDGGD